MSGNNTTIQSFDDFAEEVQKMNDTLQNSYKDYDEELSELYASFEDLLDSYTRAVDFGWECRDIEQRVAADKVTALSEEMGLYE